MSYKEIIYNERVKNTNSFNKIYLTFFKKNNVKIEVEFSYYTIKGFYITETVGKAKSTKEKIDNFLQNCESFYESLYLFDDHADFLKFKEIFLK